MMLTVDKGEHHSAEEIDKGVDDSKERHKADKHVDKELKQDL